MADRALPSGTLTFLFTDLEGSTRLLHDLGDTYGQLLEKHRQLIRDAVTAHDGIEFGTGGDALFVVFTSAPAAVSAAGAAQRALTSYSWPPGVSIRVRMALHTGEAHIVDGDYVGVSRESSCLANGVPVTLSIRNNVVTGGSWQGNVNPQGVVVMGNRLALRVDGQIDRQGIIRAQGSSSDGGCPVTFVWHKQSG